MGAVGNAVEGMACPDNSHVGVMTHEITDFLNEPRVVNSRGPVLKIPRPVFHSSLQQGIANIAALSL